MAENFIGCDREQALLLPPSLRQWLPEGHLAWFVIDAVAALDLAPLYASDRDAGGVGRGAPLTPQLVVSFIAVDDPVATAQPPVRHADLALDRRQGALPGIGADPELLCDLLLVVPLATKRRTARSRSLRRF